LATAQDGFELGYVAVILLLYTFALAVAQMAYFHDQETLFCLRIQLPADMKGDELMQEHLGILTARPTAAPSQKPASVNLLQYLLQQNLLAGKVVVKTSDLEPYTLGEPSHGHACEASLSHERARCIDDYITPWS
jgi:hypothetical protein